MTIPWDLYFYSNLKDSLRKMYESTFLTDLHIPMFNGVRFTLNKSNLATLWNPSKRISLNQEKIGDFAMLIEF